MKNDSTPNYNDPNYKSDFDKFCDGTPKEEDNFQAFVDRKENISEKVLYKDLIDDDIESTPSEGWAERFDDMFFNRTEWKIQDMRDFISREIATAKHQERQEIIKKIFEKVVLSEDQARVIRELEREK